MTRRRKKVRRMGMKPKRKVLVKPKRGRPTKTRATQRKNRKKAQRSKLEAQYNRRIAATKGAATRKVNRASSQREKTRIRREANQRISKLEIGKRSALSKLRTVQKKPASLKPKGTARRMRVASKVSSPRKAQALLRKVPPTTKPRVDLRKEPPPPHALFTRRIDVSDIAVTAKQLSRTGKLGEGKYRDKKSGKNLTPESNEKVHNALEQALPEKFQKAAETISLFGGPEEKRGKRILADWYLDYLNAPDDFGPDWPEEMTGWT